MEMCVKDAVEIVEDLGDCDAVDGDDVGFV